MAKYIIEERKNFYGKTEYEVSKIISEGVAGYLIETEACKIFKTKERAEEHVNSLLSWEEIKAKGEMKVTKWWKYG